MMQYCGQLPPTLRGPCGSSPEQGLKTTQAVGQSTKGKARCRHAAPAHLAHQGLQHGLVPHGQLVQKGQHIGQCRGLGVGRQQGPDGRGQHGEQVGPQALHHAVQEGQDPGPQRLVPRHSLCRDAACDVGCHTNRGRQSTWSMQPLR